MQYIVIDVEMNPIEKSLTDVRKQLTSEVIEIGAVRLGENLQKEDEFQCYIAPEYSPISKHITELTGITQEMVASKPIFADAFQTFIKWVGSKKTTIYSWSMADLRQLCSECQFKIKSFDTDWLVSHWVDLQKAFDTRLGLHHSLGLQDAISAMNLDFEGTAHTALADALNASKIFVLMRDDVNFRKVMTPILKILPPSDTSTNSLGKLCPELDDLSLEK